MKILDVDDGVKLGRLSVPHDYGVPFLDSPLVEALRELIDGTPPGYEIRRIAMKRESPRKGRRWHLRAEYHEEE